MQIEPAKVRVEEKDAMCSQSIANGELVPALAKAQPFVNAEELPGAVPKPSPKSKRAWRLQGLERRSLLMLVDVALLDAALLAVLLSGPYRSTFLDSLVLQLIALFVLTTLWLFFSRLASCYHLRKAASPRPSVASVLMVTSMTVGSYSAITWAFSRWLPSHRGFLLSSMFWVWLLACTSISAWHLVYATILTRPVFRWRAIAVGDPENIDSVAELVRSNLKDEYQLYGYDVRSRTYWEYANRCASPRESRASGLVDLMTQIDADEIILCVDEALTDDIECELVQCYRWGVPFITMSELIERTIGRVSLDAFRTYWYVTAIRGGTGNRIYGLCKRLFDIICSAAAIVLLSPVALVVAVMIVLDSPGPVFYSQERVGKNGRLFRMRKFRSMVPNAEETDQAVWATRGDPRVTKVGRIMRATHLDEIPQFLNVLRGDMSVVGPRPERIEFVRQLEELDPLYSLRQAILPGLTGWAQIKYSYANTVEDSLVKLEYDLFYLKRASLPLDIFILLKTISTVFSLTGT